MRDDDCIAFLQWALPRLDLHWPGFRKVRSQVCKRLRRRLAELALDLPSYRRRLESVADEWPEVERMCHITISRFFRDRRMFERLGTEVFPALARHAERIRIWSAGCAGGEEPYSLVLTWHFETLPRLATHPELSIVATDADERQIERARLACYPRGNLRDLPGGWMAVGFEQKGESWCLRDAYRVGVRLERQDLRREQPEGLFDLIACRNLAFTYFIPDLRVEIAHQLIARLRPNGILIIGAHETLPAAAPLTHCGDGIYRLRQK
jgi:chemotaxis protein methyltransferase CheR